MEFEIPKERWVGRIAEVTIGASTKDGGTRNRIVKVGGQTTLPFLRFEGTIPNSPVVGMEVWDIVPEFPKVVSQFFEHVWENTAEWAKLCVDEFGAALISLRLESTNPEEQNRSAEEAAQTVKEVLDAVEVPLIINGTGHEEKDAEVFVRCAEVAQKERCFLASAKEDKYKSIAAAALAYNQGVVAWSPIDMNIAKQVNILLTDIGLKKSDIIIDPLTGSLGYGLEYTYSVIERIRLAALKGDELLQMPILCNVYEAWGARESYQNDPYMGDVNLRGPLWEATTAVACLMAGADILIMRHPKAVEIVRKMINKLFS